MKRLFPLFMFFSSLCASVSAADYNYTLTWLAPHTHTYVVSLTVSPQTGTSTEFQLPVWRPGRYRTQDFAAAVSNFSAKDEAGKSLSWERTDVNTWRVQHSPDKKIVIAYHYYANNMDAGSSYLGQEQVYFNPVNLFMYVPGRLEGSVSLQIPDKPADWRVATQMKHTAGTTLFESPTYHDFADSPVVIARKMVTLSFELQNTTFYLHFQGDYKGDKSVDDVAVETVKKICAEQGAIFGRFPFTEYHFIYRLLPYQIRHAVEHSNSASFALPITVSESAKSIVTGIGGISAHELWHAWNVKRIRPAALWPYDYSQPQYTHLHWFTEGLTEYYASLTLVRAGLISEEQFFTRITNNMDALENNYATTIVSPAESSFESWLDNSSYKHPHREISYYALGNRLGLLMDLALREKSEEAVTLDALFNYLLLEYYDKNQGVPENGIQLAMEALTRTSWQDFFDKYVYGTEPIPYKEFLEPFGLELSTATETKPGARGFGIISYENMGQGILIRKLHPGGDAYTGGLAENDIILEIDGKTASGMSLDEYVNGLKKGDKINIRVFSDFQVKELAISYQGNFATQKFTLRKDPRIKEKEAQKLKNWLSAKAKE
ncbi:MAG: PDZ domain-containing protein [Bacteroidia bacterium]|nr:PDZ domain-containing protein [Bacteroidia bacterium]